MATVTALAVLLICFTAAVAVPYSDAASSAARAVAFGTSGLPSSFHFWSGLACVLSTTCSVAEPSAAASAAECVMTTVTDRSACTRLWLVAASGLPCPQRHPDEG